MHDESPGWDGVNPSPVPGQDGNVSKLFTGKVLLSIVSQVEYPHSDFVLSWLVSILV